MLWRSAQIILVGALVAPLRAQTVELPIVVHAGVAAEVSGAPAALPDRPFRVASGHGYVGGVARTLSRSAARGGGSGWPLAWREDPRRYSFRLPNGEYLLRLSFVETETAHPGVRVFDVLAEKRPFIEQLDIAREAGDFRWLTVEGLVAVRDGWLDIDFESSPLGGGDERRTSRLPPRVGRIEILGPPTTVPATPDAPVARGSPDFRQTRVEWTPPGTPGVVGYGIFRAPAEEGPYESLTPYPLLSTEFVDRTVGRRGEFFYRVRAYGIGGAQSSLSAPVRVAPLPPATGSLDIFELRVQADDLPGLLTRSTADRPVAGSLLFQGRTNPGWIHVETGPLDWQLRKSFHLDLDSGRRFSGRNRFRFLGETGDPTLLREAVFSAVAERAGLPSPRVDFVRLFLNGEHEGIRVNREAIDEDFLERTRLDRRGVLVATHLRGDLPLTWEPYGEQIDGGGGGLSVLTTFYHELLRVDEAEIDRWFEERFYLDRLLTRLAVLAICGRSDGAPEPRRLLGDTRNGKWDLLPDRAPEGAFGVVSFEQPAGADVSPEDARRAILGHALGGAPVPAPAWQIIETRLLGRASLRARYLDRIERLLDGVLTDEVFDSIVDEFHATLASARLATADLWPFDDGRTFERGPELLRAHFRAHREALRREIARIRATPAAAPVIAGFLLRPGEPARAGERLVPSAVASLDGAWIEIANRAETDVDLGDLRLSTDPSRPGEWALPSVQLRPGERRRITLGTGRGPFHAPLRPSPGGGVLLLARADERGRTSVVDVVFHGHQTPGVAAVRGEGDEWSYHGPLRGGAEGGDGAGDDGAGDDSGAGGNGGNGPPSWQYTWRIETDRDGGLTLGVRPGSRVEEVLLCMRPPGQPDFDVHAMTWNDREFYWTRRLPPPGGRADAQRQAFFFLARGSGGLERAYPLTGSDLPFWTPTRPRIFINEVLPRPSAQGGFTEFVELFNAGDEPVSIDGMFLTDRRRNTVRWRLTEKRPIPPRGFLVLRADGLGRGNHAPFRLSNSGEYLGLYHRHEEGNILVDQMTFSAVPVDQSWGRREDGKKGFRRWKDPTPGKPNLPQVPEEYRRKKKQEGQEAETPPGAGRKDTGSPRGG